MLRHMSDVPSGRDVAGPSSSSPDHQPSEYKRLDRILVATDGSTRSDYATRLAVELASEHQSEVLFVHVIPILDTVTTDGPDEGGAPVRQTTTEHEPALLRDAGAFARERGVAAKSTLLVGSAAAEIVAFAESNDVNMIIVGARGDGAMASALLGSVSLGVLRASGRPLLIVDGERSITYCGNGSCREVRMYGHSATDELSPPAPSRVPGMAGVTGEDFTTRISRSHRVASRLPETVAHSSDPEPGPHLRRGSRNLSASRTSDRVGRLPSLLGLLSGAIRLETVVLVGDDAWAITATIPYEGVILIAEFTTRDSASEWFAVADTLVRS